MAPSLVLAAVPGAHAARYHAALSRNSQHALTLTSDSGDALALLEDPSRHFDVLVLDARLADAATLIDRVRVALPRLIVVLVDENGDSPLQESIRADHRSTGAVETGELERLIARLLADRQLETIRASADPSIRDLARKLRRISTPDAGFAVAVEACRRLGYPYAAFYDVSQQTPVVLKLAAQQGQSDIDLLVPLSAAGDDVLALVATDCQSRILTAEHGDGYLPVTVGSLGCAALVAAGKGPCYGVLVAGHADPKGITEPHVATLELIAAQLAAVITRDLGV